MVDRTALAKEKEKLVKQEKELVSNYDPEKDSDILSSIQPLNKRIEEINIILLDDIDKEAGVTSND